VKPYFAGTNFDFATRTRGELTFLSDNTNLSVDPHYKSPYTDQFIASLERDIGKGVAATLNYVHKRGEDYPAWQETQGTYALVPFTDDLEPNATGNTFNLFQLTSDPALRHFVITNPDGVGSRVNAASLNIVKRMTNNWQVNASATWLRSTGIRFSPCSREYSLASISNTIDRCGISFTASILKVEAQNP